MPHTGPLRSTEARAPVGQAGNCCPAPPQETLRCSKAGLAQSLLGFLGPSAHKFLCEPSKHFWWVWNLLLNMISPSYHLIGASSWPLDTVLPQDWKRSVFIPIPKRGNAKECSNYHTIPLISHTSKVMLKILQARLQSTKTENFQMFKLDLEKAEESEIKLPTSVGSSIK